MAPSAPRKRPIRPLAFVAGLALASYAAVVGLLWGLQARFVFFPTTGEYDATPDALDLPWRDLRLETGDGVELAAWYIEGPSADAPAVLFLHGNAGDMSHRLDRIAALHRLGAAVLIIDYRGYGESGGQPSEAGLEHDARAAWHWLVREAGYGSQRIIVQGRSLGAALAASLAAEHDPAALVLESAFTSLPALAADLYPWLPARHLTRLDFDTAGALARTRCPLLLAHARDDEIVPYTHARTLADIRPEATTFVRLGGGHNDRTLVVGSAFHAAVAERIAAARSGAR